jgi:protein-disulfide isomerase
MRQIKRNQERQRKERAQSDTRLPLSERISARLVWSGLSVVIIVAIVLIVLAVSGVFNKEPKPVYILTPSQMELLATVGTSEGSPTSPVTLLEFGDFQCSHCRVFWKNILKPLKEEFMGTGQLRVVFRHMAFLGPESTLAAEATECAADQNMFFPYHDLLYEQQNPPNQGHITEEWLTGLANDLGMETDQFTQCLQSDEKLSRVQISTEQAHEMGIPGTPTVLINGRLVPDFTDLDAIRSVIRQEISLAKW